MKKYFVLIAILTALFFAPACTNEGLDEDFELQTIDKDEVEIPTDKDNYN
ncbi:hypothetical protein [Leptobacterium sp. I13]